MFLSGLAFQLMTTAIDGQRREFRLCNGLMKINDKDPFYIVAKYRKDTGEGATNLLLGKLTLFHIIIKKTIIFRKWLLGLGTTLKLHI